jgi:hypothetical protein
MLPSWAPHREFFATPLFSFVPNGRNIFERGSWWSILLIRLNSDRAMILHEFAVQCAWDRSEKRSYVPRQCSGRDTQTPSFREGNASLAAPFGAVRSLFPARASTLRMSR